MRKRFRLPVVGARWPLLVILIAVAVVVWQRQAIQDWAMLYNYTPPTSVSQLADDMTATPRARRLFYINHPSIEDRSAFNRSCSNNGEHTIVLGCYHPVDRGIYIFHVSDDRLSGVDQVTAAHEMLHAAYDRLSAPERQRINGLLQNYYDHGNTDARITKIIDAYKVSEPNDVQNEMHSIFATEIGGLPAELETYYKQYFTDRSRVVAYASSYQAEFTSRQNQVAAYDKTLGVLRSQIDTNTAELTTEETEITAQRAQMDRDRQSGDIEAYNQRVPIYNAGIDAYNAKITVTRQLIARYNRLVGERNQLALQVTELAHSIDSSFQQIEN